MSFSTTPETKKRSRQPALDEWFSQDESKKKRKFVDDEPKSTSMPTIQEEGSDEGERFEPYVPPPITDWSTLPTSRQQQLVLMADKDDNPSIGLPAQYGNFGEDIRSKHPTNQKAFKKAYRMQQMQFLPGSGKSGLDEKFSTSNTAKTVVGDVDEDEAENAIRFLSSKREPVSNMMWTQPDDSDVLASHPGSLSKVQSDMRKGITGGHNTRDAVRANWSLNEINSGANPLDPESLRNASIMSDLMTTQVMSQPYAQLSTAKPDSSTQQAYSARFGPFYQGVGTSSVSLTPKADSALRDVHNQRETRKWQSAEEAMRSGYQDLVGDEHKKYLEANNGIWSEAMSAYLQDHPPAEKDTGPSSSAAFIPDDATRTGTTQTLQQWNDEAKKGSMKRGVSNPREFLKMARERDGTKKPKTKKQEKKSTQSTLSFPKKPDTGGSSNAL